MMQNKRAESLSDIESIALGINALEQRDPETLGDERYHRDLQGWYCYTGLMGVFSACAALGVRYAYKHKVMSEGLYVAPFAAVASITFLSFQGVDYPKNPKEPSASDRYHLSSNSVVCLATLAALIAKELPNNNYSFEETVSNIFKGVVDLGFLSLSNMSRVSVELQNQWVESKRAAWMGKVAKLVDECSGDSKKYINYFKESATNF